MRRAKPNYFSSFKRTIIVAEISANHGQSFKRAVDLIKKAKLTGVDAVKFQAYTPDTLTIDVNNKYFRIRHKQWGGLTLYELYKQAYTPWRWFKELKRIAVEEGLLFFSTAFDKSSVDFLEELGVPLHKVSSFELTDLPLLEYVSKTGKPMILSTGMSTLSEIKQAFVAVNRIRFNDTMLLKCVSSYPALAIEMNLKTIIDMKKRFKCEIGFSDHSLELALPITAVALGARLVEKHFTLSRAVRTPDSFFSLEPQEFKQLVDNIRATELSLGQVSYGLTAKEKENLIFKRSLFAVKDVHKGEKLTNDNIRSIRPAFGLPPKFLPKVLGRHARRNIKRGTPLSTGLII